MITVSSVWESENPLLRLLPLLFMLDWAFGSVLFAHSLASRRNGTKSSNMNDARANAFHGDNFCLGRNGFSCARESACTWVHLSARWAPLYFLCVDSVWLFAFMRAPNSKDTFEREDFPGLPSVSRRFLFGRNWTPHAALVSSPLVNFIYFHTSYTSSSGGQAGRQAHIRWHSIQRIASKHSCAHIYFFPLSFFDSPFSSSAFLSSFVSFSVSFRSLK